MELTTAKLALDARELALLDSEMRGRAKSMVVAYLLWFILGWMGAHWFYLGRSGRGWTYAITLLVALVTTVILVGLLILAAFSILLLVDLIRIYEETKTINTKTEAALIAQILEQRSAG